MMKNVLLFLMAFLLSSFIFPQHNVQVRNLWEQPHVHVIFEGYTLSFTLKDINKALQLLAETGDSIYGLSSGLDTGKDYTVELYEGTGTEYLNTLQPILQNAVGAFLLTAGHAEIRNKKGRVLKDIIVDVGTLTKGEDEVVVRVQDPKNNHLIFWGKMKIEMYHKDLGID